ncbi:MAG: hypothetical protein HRU11_14515 [Parvularculaceae bacterium]|nr:hypothetical protein [Parvularculaceae bacterium]
MAICIGRLTDSAPRARKLCDCPRVICAAPDYLDAHGVPVSLEDLLSHETIGYGNATIGCVWRFANGTEEPRTIRVTPRLTFNNGGAMRAAAVKGLGITVLPRFIVADALVSRRLLAIELNVPPLSDSVDAVFHRGQSTPVKIRTFIDFLIGALKL